MIPERLSIRRFLRSRFTRNEPRPQGAANRPRRQLLLLTALAASTCAQSFSGSPALDDTVNQAVKDQLIPGAVLIVGHDGKILHRKAYGSRALVPTREAMTVDTIFDAASLTKVIATTSAVMKLFEEGKIRIADPVNVYLPDFQNGKSEITIRDLMTHFSGLRPDLDLEPAWTGYDIGIGRALAEKSTAPPGARFVYSDINFELMGEIVHRLSGKTLDQFTHDEIFEPLAMHETMFKPPASLRSRIAPTELDPATNRPFRGVVHDPTARYMGGVAGHAGLFTTADDLAKFATMMLGEGKQIFSPLTIKRFTSPNTPPDQPILRGLGWDIDSSYSSNRGELFPIGSFGHTGFTGTSVWIDPSTKSFVILLTNSVHPHRGKNLSAFRSKVATIAAATIGVDAPGVSVVSYNEGLRRMIVPNHTTLTGLDVLEQEKFAALKGKRVGLITNHTGIDRAGRRNIDAMIAAGVRLTTLFSPEHGITGKEDRQDVADTKDTVTGLPIWSLHYNGRYRMTPEMLHDVDTLVFDIQDAGSRFYTYSCTLLYALEEAGKSKVPFYVLDRPNPVTGTHVEGPL
ncbi:MAG: serine hydrolase, partial [Acidobacteriia bacterium]|nr:serine hydrolase [Terriglobia bacterium]